MATVSYSASLRTRKTNSSSDAKSDRACQEFYSDDYNYVGIIHFSGMDLRNKIITGVSIKATSASAGYGASHTKTVYLRKSNYQAAAASGVTGAGYAGAALGTAVTFLLALLLALSTRVLTIISSLGVTLSLLLFVTGDYKNGGIFLLLAWLISPIGLPLIAEWLWRGLDNVRGMMWRIVFC
ncbi:MAG: hypothetical protein E7337_08930 [Clostridiales bacterium]|nr:hypothetical protein [Clostridiales bacterium]